MEYRYLTAEDVERVKESFIRRAEEDHLRLSFHLAQLAEAISEATATGQYDRLPSLHMDYNNTIESMNRLERNIRIATAADAAAGSDPQALEAALRSQAESKVAAARARLAQPRGLEEKD